MSFEDWIATCPDEGQILQFCFSRKLTDLEQGEIVVHLNNFFAEWASHGKNNTGSSFFVWNQMLLISIAKQEGGMVSGCSKDSLRHFLAKLAVNFNVQFFSGEKLVFLEGDSVELVERSAIESIDFESKLWVNTGLSRKKSFLKGQWLQDPNTVF